MTRSPDLMLSHDEFSSQLADAYEHLHDLVYLRTHPLAGELCPPSLRDREKARQLHNILIDAIEDLNPGPDAPPFSHEWRRHRLMVLRYVQGLNPQAVADQLAVSLRHYYREQKAAIEVISDILWSRHVESAAESAPSGPDSPPLTDDRLELLRLEAARMAHAGRHAHVSSLVQGVLILLKPVLQQRGLEFRLTLPDSLPDVAVEGGLLRQLLLGTLGYLVEHASLATVHLRARVAQEMVCLSIGLEPADRIRPIPAAEEVDRLAGLAEMAELAGLRLTALRTGEGISGFDLTLPPAQRGILVVDDNEDVLELFQRYLAPYHYQVLTASTGRSALDLACRLRPDVIILDLMMPDIDGWDLLQMLLNQPETGDIPLIVCSVLRQKELALSLGATAFLSKPVNQQDLLSALRALESPEDERC